MFLIWNCLDRYLAPRFLFLSLVLLVALLWQRRRLVTSERFGWQGFDLLILGWYGMNIASIFWAFSWSESIFYTQKVLLLCVVYALFRQWLHTHETRVWQTMRQITQALTATVCIIIIVQLGLAISEHGLDNNTLYDYASGVFGNKSLAADFLFFLFIFNALFWDSSKNKILNISLLLIPIVLILLLQVRTVYGALAITAILYAAVYVLNTGLSTAARRTWLLAVGTGLLLFVSMFFMPKTWIPERLNPTTYLESTSFNERRFVWYKTDLLNAEHYWLGVGNGSWKFWFPSKSIAGAYRIQEENIVFTRAHNDFLEIRSELGIIGVGLFCLLFIVAIGTAVHGIYRDENRRELTFLSTGLIGYCIIQYFDFPRERIEMQVVLAILFAGITHFRRHWWQAIGAFPQSVSIRRSVFILVVVGLAFNVIIGYARVQGEIHNVRALKAKVKSNWPLVIKEVEASENIFYEYDDTAFPLRWTKGTAQFHMKQMDAASTTFEESVALNPWNFQVLHHHAVALTQQNKCQEAIPVYERAHAINPYYDELKFNLAFAHEKLGNTDEAIGWINKIDTVANPQTDFAKAKNKTTLEKKATMLKALVAVKK